MAAGTMGPVASAFSICALVRPWRQHIPPGSTVTLAEYMDDPPWLLVVNALQLVVALVANLFLLLNMTRRVRFSLGQPITIAGWYVSSLCLIALSATAAGPLAEDMEPRIDYVWSQAFYYGIFAAIIYLIVASLLVVTFVGAQSGRYAKDFQLSTSQRTLMLQTIMLLMYLLLGALVFSKIEGWTYLDAVYWADVTLFTVGFGDMSAQTSLGRALLLPYALVGVISLGLVIGSIRSLALERGKHRLDARMIEKKRRRKVRQMTRKGKDGILVPIQDDHGDGDGDEPGPSFTLHGRRLTEFDRRGEEFELMRRIQHQAAVRRRWNAMAMSAGTWVALWLAGAAIFQNCEQPYQNWSYFDGVYFAFVSLTTIGYGDVTPVSNSGKAFFVFWSLLALPTMTILISNAGDTLIKGVRDGTNYLGTITILPGDTGTRKELKKVFRMLSCGRVFGDDDDGVREDPPGFLGAAQPPAVSESSDDDDDVDNDDDEDEGKADEDEDRKETDDKATRATADAEKGSRNGESPSRGSSPEPVTTNPDESPTTPTAAHASRKHAADPASDALPNLHKSTSNRTTQSARSSSSRGSDSNKHRLVRRVSTEPRAVFPDTLPSTRAARNVLLIDEIAGVTAHLRHQPPRKYTFREWAWYLRLVGEDEHSAETHRKAQPHVHAHHALGKKAPGALGPLEEHGGGVGVGVGVGASETKLDEMRDERDRAQWSWVGARSPLMGSQEEAEWILEKLTMKLQEELRAVEKEEETATKRKGAVKVPAAD